MKDGSEKALCGSWRSRAWRACTACAFTGWQRRSRRLALVPALLLVALLTGEALRAQGVGAPAAGADQGIAGAVAAPQSSFPAGSAGSPGSQTSNPSSGNRGQAGAQQGSQPERAGDASQFKSSERTQTEDRTPSEDRNQTADPNANRIPQPTQTAFQRLVQTSTGSVLPIFGSQLFFNRPSTFAQVQDVPVSADYILGPGDTLQISLYGQLNRQNTYTVSRTGDIAIEGVGTVHVAGIRFDQLPAFLKLQYSRVFRNFELTVNLAQLRSIQVFVVGAARSPGAYTVSSLSTLLNAIFASGGVLPTGSLRDIQLLRGGVAVVHFDLYDLLLHGDKSHDVRLEPGDVIFIPPVGPQAAITGSVNVPAIYELRPGTTVAQLIALSGGETSLALGSRIRVERIYEHSTRYLLDVDAAQEGGLPVENGDVITIGAIVDRFRDSVTLRGNVAYPGRYVWHAGMHIRDLVPDREALITREYYARRTALGTPFATAAPDQPGALQVSGGNGQTQAADRAVQSGQAGSGSSVSGGNSTASSQTATSGIFPSVNDVVLSAPDIDWDYAVVERLDARTLKTSLIPFSPGKLFLDGDAAQNLELQSGDVVTFFSTADVRVPTSQQTRFVRLEGEFNGSGVYSVEPGETLRHLLARAGGFTADAYLYGSSFTRQSTERVQQQRLNEYADNLEAQISVYATTSNSRAVSDRDVAASNAAVIAARQSIARLRLAQPTGRIVLQLKPDSRGVDSVPDLPLEDGDRFVVPRVPSTVTVEGQVYSANAFVFERGLRERNYLRKAGGPDRQADRNRTFILRADGSVFSQQYGDVTRANIFPGDTIVVPPQFDRRAILRNLVDIATVVSQFGFGIAAINVVR